MPVAFYLVDYKPKDGPVIKDIIYDPNYNPANVKEFKTEAFLPLYAERVSTRVNNTAWEGNVWNILYGTNPARTTDNKYAHPLGAVHLQFYIPGGTEKTTAPGPVSGGVAAHFPGPQHSLGILPVGGSWVPQTTAVATAFTTIFRGNPGVSVNAPATGPTSGGSFTLQYVLVF